MSVCADVRLQLGARALGEPPDDPDDDAVGQHLAVCPDCSAELAELRASAELLSLAREAPPQLPDRVRDRVVAQAARQRTRRRWLAVAAAVAVLAATAGGVTVHATRPPAADVAVPLEAVEPYDASGWATFRGGPGRGVTVELEIEDLEPLPPPQVYEAWLSTADERIESIGQLSVADGEGAVRAELVADADLGDYRGFWLTVEPDHRDPAHDGPTVVRSPVPRPR